mgnify:FL=1
MKKIGLVICYFHENYGSMLQAYATQHIFDRMGAANEAVYCRDPHMYMTMPKPQYYFHKLTNKDLLLDKIKRSRGKIFHKIFKTDFHGSQSIRSAKFQEFSGRAFRVSKEYHNREELIRDAENYAAFVVGSDQLWSPANIDNDFYTLTFVPEGIPKIAYATSFGTAAIPSYQHKKARAFLERLDYISVREVSGKKLVKELSGRDAQVVIDPTLMLNRQDWQKFRKKAPIGEDRYIFCYFLGNNRSNREFALRLKEKTGYRIVALVHMDEFVREDEDFADLTPYDVGPEEFVDLVSRAEYVCTDSFHGTVFSIIFGRRFFTFNRFSQSSTISTNTRIDSLLAMLSLEDRRKTGSEDISECMAQKIDFDRAYEKLEQKQKEAEDYLKRALRCICRI